MQIETERLVLRPFEASDAADVAAMNADPKVMRFFPAPLTAEESRARLDVWIAKQARFSYAFSAVLRRADGAFLGMCGISRLEEGLPVAPCTEIGWRLIPAAWGQGIASEAAHAWLRVGFETFALTEILSFTPEPNRPSAAVMARIGMRPAPDLAFGFPSIPADNPLHPAVVYRLRAEEWRAQQVRP